MESKELPKDFLRLSKGLLRRFQATSNTRQGWFRRRTITTRSGSPDVAQMLIQTFARSNVKTVQTKALIKQVRRQQMWKRRRTEITVEKHERLVVKRRGRALLQCPSCAEGAVMITPEQAATLVGVSLRTIFHWVETGRVHFAESANENLSICLASLPVRAY